MASRGSLWGDNTLDQLISMDFWREAVERGKPMPIFAAEPSEPFRTPRLSGGPGEVRSSWHELADYLNETVIRRAIQHDLRMDPEGRDAMRNFSRRSSGCVAAMPDKRRESLFVPEIQQALRATSTGAAC